MVVFGESDKIIKVEMWINQTLTTGFFVIFRSLFTELLIKNEILPVNPL